MRNTCYNSGTICASIILCGNHGIPKLHICIGHIMLPSCDLIAIGYSATLILTVGDPFMRKCEEASESDSTYSTRRTSCFVLNIVATLSDFYILSSATISSIFLLCFWFKGCLLLSIPFVSLAPWFFFSAWLQSCWWICLPKVMHVVVWRYPLELWFWCFRHCSCSRCLCWVV